MGEKPHAVCHFPTAEALTAAESFFFNLEVAFKIDYNNVRAEN